MWSLILLVAFYAVFHFGLFMPAVPAGIFALIIYGVFWLVWKLRYLILAAIGLEMLLGDRDD